MLHRQDNTEYFRQTLKELFQKSIMLLIEQKKLTFKIKDEHDEFNKGYAQGYSDAMEEVLELTKTHL